MDTSSDAPPDGEHDGGHSWHSLLALEAEITERLEDYYARLEFLGDSYAAVHKCLSHARDFSSDDLLTSDTDSDSELHSPVTCADGLHCDEAGVCEADNLDSQSLNGYEEQPDDYDEVDDDFDESEEQPDDGNEEADDDYDNFYICEACDDPDYYN